MITRRNFLKASAAGAVASAFHPLPALAGQAPPVALRAGVFRQRIVPEGQETEMWGFNGTTPGPILRFRRGDTVRIDVANELPDLTTVHWHGVRVPNAMDGVPYVTQKPIPQKGSFTYEFPVPDSGTFWYHPHQKSFEQVGRGLFGAFIVEEDNPIEVDREVLWVLADFKLWPDQQQVDDFGNMRDFAGAGRIGNVVTLNGRAVSPATRLEVRSGERIRLRVLNCASARIMSLGFAGHSPTVIAYDGQAITPHTRERVVLGSGMRVDLILDCTGKPGDRFPITDAHDRNRELAGIVYLAEAPVRQRPSTAPLALAPNPLPEPALSKAVKHLIVFQGGMSGQPALGMVDGKPLGIREMMEAEGLAWTINLSAAHEQALLHVPFLHLKLGESVILTMVNQTGFEHPMHLHGYTFKVLTVNGQAPRYPEWRDTVLIAPRETVEVAFVADNPGDWMFHCHILEHAAGGMMGTIRVA